ncbi:indole-3-glycerol phosphate synthase [Ruminococcus sp. YE71]|uniref:indole-3-glycerol phosphate synthase TrpC n=1 Tax=unclassified Ruminococcus TaxID=2608920 RepID=UPI000885C48D|nr:MULTISPECIES: indole-3-glycerol phosphate synthase TrpC [unclassified Ruminococcus]SDA23696.1 indole-3-glycerol phosphate synthase [Ruminococcus sp. YE78]SFW40294.1 indole-3-glycerol phosphate synthase [Ruminococcus sp. YE71]
MILDDIIAYRKKQLERETEKCPLNEMRRRAEIQLCDRVPLSLADALRGDRLACICEVKKASPSKGLIRPDFRPVDFAKEYEAAGANAISCLTEEHYFQGSSEYLAAIRKAVNIPILRKDFIFDEYQLFEAAAIGADAVLLIAAVLDENEFSDLYRLAKKLGLSVLGEMHTVEEMQRYAIDRPEMVVGVNNRNLKTFEVDLATVEKVKPYAPEGTVFVSESGIKTNDDMKRVRSLGADAVLIGETLMRADSITNELNRLREGV